MLRFEVDELWTFVVCGQLVPCNGGSLAACGSLTAFAATAMLLQLQLRWRLQLRAQGAGGFFWRAQTSCSGVLRGRKPNAA